MGGYGSPVRLATPLALALVLATGCAKLARPGMETAVRTGGGGACWSANTVSQADVDGVNPLHIEEMLRRVPGVRVTMYQSGFSVEIRGLNTFTTNTEPLYVIDGLPFTGTRNGIIPISPDDVQCIEVLKDISQTALFGTRGSNGVVLITTRRGL